MIYIVTIILFSVTRKGRFHKLWIRTLILTGLLLVSTCIPVSIADESDLSTEILHFSFSNPEFTDLGDFFQIAMKGTNSYLYDTGTPLLPIATQTLDLPFGTKIKDIVIDVNSVQSVVIDKPIQPAPAPFHLTGQFEEERYPLNPFIYQSDFVFPNAWYSYSMGSGLNSENEHVSKLTLVTYPIRFLPKDDAIEYAKSISITIFYEAPEHTYFPTMASYDMVIIAPYRFVQPLELLAQHKNDYGIRTLIKPVHEIYPNYPGQDRPEKIKYFIKDAIESWGVTYVLLVGGLKSIVYGNPRDDINQGTIDWFVPVRYTNLVENNTAFDPGFIADLYYADIYDADGNFSDWDTNNDGVYGKWSDEPNPRYNPNKPTHMVNPYHPPPEDTDIIDFFPDVHLGRLPCRNLAEVIIMVSKIINYETSPAEPSWFNRMVVVGGDPYDDVGTDIIEGEEICEKALEHMDGFVGVKLYASNQHSNPRLTPLSRNIIREINKGCGFLLFDGHGSPGWWNTFWPYQFDKLIVNGGLSVYQFPSLMNGRRLPICVIGGCHNAMFNTSLVNSMWDTDNSKKMWSYGMPVAECWAWELTNKLNGGAIATIGSTGLGYEADGEHGDIDGDGILEPDCVEVLGGFLETEFFNIVNHNMMYLGDAWNGAITRYLKQHPAFFNQSYAKTIEQWVLIGDPSLRIGGYC